MADDQVKYSDLIADDVVKGLELLNKALQDIKTTMAGVKEEAASLGVSLKNVSTATREQQQQVSAGATAADQLRAKLEQLRDAQNKNLAGWTLLTRSIDGTNMSYDQMKATIAALEKVLHTLTTEEEKNSMGAQSAKEAISRLKAAMKSFSTTTEEVVRVNREYKKLTDEEIASVEALKAALNGTKMQQMDAVKAIDIQSKSYNELYQTYNAIKDVLNGMTVAERENSEAGKLMVDRAKEIRDTLNNLQQATGNYTLNVGNYMSALNGLQFQTQQVLREIPSAQNFSQFFLAISNNIPMFADALARYNQGLPEIKAKLAAVTAEIARQNAAMAAMNVQSTEYAAAQARLNELQRQQQQLQGASVSGWRAILKAVGSWQTLLIAGLLLLRKMPDIVKAIAKWWDRWRNGVKEVKNEVGAIGAMARLQADVIKKTADEVTELRLVVDRLKDVKQGTDEWVAGIKTVNDITKSTLDATKATPEEVQKVTDAYIRQANQLAKNAVLSDMIGKSMANQSLRDVAYHPGTYGTARQALGLEIGSKDEKEFNRLFTAMNQAVRDYNNKVRRTEWASVRDAAGNMTMRRVEENENLAANRRRKEMNDAIQDYRNFINKRLEVLSPEAVKKLQEQYELIDPMGSGGGKGGNGKKEKEPTEQNVNLRLWDAVKARIRVEKEGYDEERALAKANYEQSLEELRNWALREQAALKENRDNGFITEEEYQQKLKNLNSNYFDLRKGLRDEYDKAIEASIQKEIDEEEKAAKEKIAQEEKDFKAKQEIAKREFELTKHTATEEKKFVMQQQLEFLKWRIDHAEALGISPELLEVMRKEYDNMFAEFQKGNYSTGGKNVKGNYSNIIDLLFPDMTKDQQSALNSVFDQAKEALNSWMDARKAAADQAKELADDEVSAAENALNREIELRNQGYANNVALRERELADAKEKQKQAVEEQKKIAQQQILLDAALQTSSLITASANIWKQFATQPWLAAAMLATMWGSFGYAKIKAYQASTKSIQFREGGVMMLEGGSHESGHDVNLGIGPDGSNLRAEGGEYFAVINKRNSRKYGSEIPAVVNALNSGMFEDRYIKTSDAVGMLPRIIRADNGSEVDLSAVESGVGELVKQGETSYSVEGEYKVIRYKNLTRRVKIG